MCTRRCFFQIRRIPASGGILHDGVPFYGVEYLLYGLEYLFYGMEYLLYGIYLILTLLCTKNTLQVRIVSCVGVHFLSIFNSGAGGTILCV